MSETTATPSRIMVTGASGLLGRALVAFLQAQGHTVRTLGRGATGDPHWDPARGELDRAALTATEAVVHLAGEPLTGLWTARKRQAIFDSRQQGTRLLAETLATLEPLPRVLISASAVGFYGDRGDETLTEADGAGQGFLAEVCQAWEAATQPAQQAGIRVVHLRLGVVASSHGGAFPRMLLPFRWGLGQPLGEGAQYLSWIALPDLLNAIAHCLREETLHGPVNAVAPTPVTNREFAQTAARLLHRWTLPAMPAFALRAAAGQMADEMLLSSARVRPQRLLDGGFVFQYPKLAPALGAVIDGII